MRRLAVLFTLVCAAGIMIPAHAAVATCSASTPGYYLNPSYPNSTMVDAQVSCTTGNISITGARSVTITLGPSTSNALGVPYTGRLSATFQFQPQSCVGYNCTPNPNPGCAGGSFTADFVAAQAAGAATSPPFTVGSTNGTCIYMFTVNPTGAGRYTASVSNA